MRLRLRERQLSEVENWQNLRNHQFFDKSKWFELRVDFKQKLANLSWFRTTVQYFENKEFGRDYNSDKSSLRRILPRSLWVSNRRTCGFEVSPKPLEANPVTIGNTIKGTLNSQNFGYCSHLIQQNFYDQTRQHFIICQVLQVQ